MNFYEVGQELLARRQIAKALECFHAAQQSGFPVERCAAARWDCWMLTGQFEQAWAESDLIAATGAPDPHRFWDGQPWAGRHVMLRCLHGLGDTIQFIRYAPLLRTACRSLTVQTHPQLTTLLEGVPGVDRVITWEQPEGPWDLQMEVTELPRAFRTTLATLPGECPYVYLPPERVVWAAQWFPQRRGLRIGVCWRSGPWDSSRNIAMEQFTPLLVSGRHQFFNLQKGSAGASLLDLEHYAGDVRATAALILNLDLVITVDTMTAHLAGALGRPVWILLPSIADWRWMLDRRDTPWYPTARLFRQSQQGDWSAVMEQVGAALNHYESAGGDCGGPLRPTDICTPPLPAENR